MNEEMYEVAEEVIENIVDALVEEPIGVKNATKKEILLQLFLSTLYISSCTFGGGFVIITFMKRKFVDTLHWIDEEEMLDLTALAQSAPGAIAVNAAILIGWKVCGFWGMVVAVFGTIIPPMCILIGISFCYNAFATNVYVAMALKGMQAGVAAVIFDVVYGLGEKVYKEKNNMSIFILLAAFCATFFFQVNVIFVILTATLLGVVKAIYLGKRGVKA